MVRRNPVPRLAGALLPFVVFVFGYLAFKSARYGILIGFLIFRNRSQREVVGLFYITDPSASTKTHLIELGFCLSSLLRRLRSCSGEGESGFWEAPSATAHFLRHGSCSVQVWCCGIPSSAAPVATICSKDRLRPVCAVHLSGGSRSVGISRLDPVHNHIF